MTVTGVRTLFSVLVHLLGVDDHFGYGDRFRFDFDDRLGGDRFGSDRLGHRDPRDSERDLDRRTRDWTAYRGRRRAAESGFGRRGRRELARERTGALLTSGGGGQSASRKDRPDHPAAAPALG